jgi:hypothetical protein
MLLSTQVAVQIVLVRHHAGRMQIVGTPAQGRSANVPTNTMHRAAFHGQVLRKIARHSGELMRVAEFARTVMQKFNLGVETSARRVNMGSWQRLPVPGMYAQRV